MIDITKDIAEDRWQTYYSENADTTSTPFDVIEHDDGIYLNLPQLDYLNDWALSYSAFKTLLSSPPDWHWESVFNRLVDNVKRKETPAMRFGSALHAALLEGMPVYERKFGIVPTQADHPKALRTVEEIRHAIKTLGASPKGNKPQLIDQLLQLNPRAKILDAIVDEWRQTHRGVTELNREEDTQIRLMVQLARRHPELASAFSGNGLSEVSVFWTDINDVRQRARFDRVKPNASIDLKTFSNWQGRDFKKALLREAALRMYDLQANHYDVARHEMKRLAEEGAVFLCFDEKEEDVDGVRWGVVIDNDGEVLRERELKKDEETQTLIVPADEETIARVREVLATPVWEWVWIFYKTDGAPTAQPVRLDRKTKAFERGGDLRQGALTSFLYFKGMFDLDRMWVRLDPMWTPDDEDWPFFMSADVS